MSSLVLFNMLVDALGYLIVGFALGLWCLDDESLRDLAGADIGDLDDSAIVYERVRE